MKANLIEKSKDKNKHVCGGRLMKLYIHPQGRWLPTNLKWCDKCHEVLRI